MKVILLRDVANMGKKFDVVTVPDGYAINKLLPSGMATSATPENIKRITGARDKVTANKHNEVQKFTSALASLADTPVVIKTKVNEQGHLFEALKPVQVTEALKAHNITLDPTTITLSPVVKEAGTHVITISFMDQKVPLTVSIIAA